MPVSCSAWSSSSAAPRRSSSGLVLLLTLVAVAGVGPSLPGPPIRSWLGLGDPQPPVPCRFDPADVRHPRGRQLAGSWRPEPSAPSSAPELAAARVGGYVYMVGGQTPLGAEKTILRFDPRHGEYRRVGRLPVALDHPVVSAHKGDVVVAGGYIEGADATNRAWSFTPRTGEIRELPPMRFPRGAAAGAVLGERLYVAGGLLEFGNQYEPRRSLEIYDFERRTWTRGPDMPTPRHHFGATALHGRLYFAGGRRPSDLSLSAFEEFDPSSESWRRLPSLPVGAGSAGVAAAAGSVIVVGGGEDHRDDHGGNWVLRTVYAYDPGSSRWTRLPDMRKPRHGLAVAVSGGRLYAFRGIPCPGYGRTASAESLDLN
jgi:Kelch motif